MDMATTESAPPSEETPWHSMSVDEVARRTGYADQPHLIRSLRRLVGQTPSRVASSAPGG